MRKREKLKLPNLCPTCNGEGITKRGKTCPTCKGKGILVPLPKDYKKKKE